MSSIKLLRGRLSITFVALAVCKADEDRSQKENERMGLRTAFALLKTFVTASSPSLLLAVLTLVREQSVPGGEPSQERSA